MNNIVGDEGASEYSHVRQEAEDPFMYVRGDDR